jgi:dihydroorotate dehydrogenase
MVGFSSLSEIVYKNIAKPVLFSISPDRVHERMTGVGETLGEWGIVRKGVSTIFARQYPALYQNIDGIEFDCPIGLSAGFDYDARLMQITPSLGFGFHTIGTITRDAYGGNPPPILGRLPNSRSLMVNKGFKNKGVEHIVTKLSGKRFSIPIGVSIGRTNSASLSTHEQCINDIVSSFSICEHSSIYHSYYELNISCPNLVNNVSFYEPKQLDLLLEKLDILLLRRPLYIKMPIECRNGVILALLEVIKRHDVQGVIFGNLQKNRKDPAFDAKEVEKFNVGNFSGKPTEERSNELITLAYRYYKDRFTIIGCGGVFSAEDAYLKIKLGASLVQLITGMVYNGPQLVSQINYGLNDLLKKDGHCHISEVIGKGIE